MIKSIQYEGQHQIQTSFGILDCLYSTRELNTIPFVGQKYYKADLLAAFSKNIFLHVVAEKIITSNKIALSYNCKMSYAMKSSCKCQKNNTKYS